MIFSCLLIGFMILTFTIRISFARAEEASGLDMSTDDLQKNMELAKKQDEDLLRIVSLFSTRAPEEGEGPSLLYSLMEGEEGTQVIGKVGRSITTMTGMILVLAYASIQLLQIAQREDKSIESLMQVFITAFIGFLVIIYIYDILTAIENIGSLVYDNIISGLNSIMTFDDGRYVVESVGTSISAAGFDPSTGTLSQETSEVLSSSLEAETTRGTTGFVGSILLSFTFYMLIASAYGLVFELAIRKIFAPIAAADFVSEGLRSPGARYLKNYLGIYVRMAMFGVIIALGWAASSWAYQYPGAAKEINSGLGKLGAVYCIRFAMKALINASGQTAREILGG